jgi:hypothetical protein
VQHYVRNGLLLRSDVHRPFDAGFITVTPDLHVEASGRMRADFDDGENYVKLHGGRIRVPDRPDTQPDPDALRWHNENVYRGRGVVSGIAGLQHGLARFARDRAAPAGMGVSPHGARRQGAPGRPACSAPRRRARVGRIQNCLPDGGPPGGTRDTGARTAASGGLIRNHYCYRSTAVGNREAPLHDRVTTRTLIALLGR